MRLEKAALLIIDMQKGSFTAMTPRYDTDGVVDRINKLAQRFRSVGRPVIFIQHDGSREDEFLPNTPEWEILDDLSIEDNDLRITKYANDCFYLSSLAAVLDDDDVSDIYVTGCATDFCVEATIQSALSKNFNVYIIEDGHTTGDRPNLSAKRVIDHYNWVWNNMIPTLGEIMTLPAKNLLPGD